MLDAKQIESMSEADRAQLLDRLATTFYATDRYAPRLSRDLGVNQGTIYRWIGLKSPIPFAVLLVLDSWQDSDKQAANVLRDWDELPEQLEAVVQSLSRVTATLARIARRLPAGNGDILASVSAPPPAADCLPDTEAPSE